MLAEGNENAEKVTVHEIDKKQLDIARAKIKKQKDERAVAKEEEKNWVEFRKLQVLYDCQPKSRAASRRDDSFPRRRRGVSMGFGERKAYFLAIRPNPRYATWFGKKKNWQNWQSREKTQTDKHKKKVHGEARAETPPKQKVFCVPALDVEKTGNDEENEVEKKGNHALNPLIRGIPFWITPEEGEELNEEDLPIDRELIEKVLDGRFNIVSNSIVRKKFDPYSEVESYKRLDKFFTRELIIGDTVKTVINLMEEPNDNMPTKVDEKQRLVTWGRMVFVSSVDLSQSNTEPTLIGRPEPMRDIVRGPVKKSM